MEGTHGKLCTGFTDRLRCNDTNRLAYLNSFTGSHVCTITLCTDTYMRAAGKNGTDLNLLNRLSLLIHTNAEDLCSPAGCNHMVGLHDHVAVSVFYLFAGISSCNSVLQIFNGFLAIHEGGYPHTGDRILSFHTVNLTDDQIL